MSQPNPSTAQARVFADEFRRQGVDVAFVSPGSRSAALAIALEECPEIDVSVVLDERSAAFRAIGAARATGRPAICLSTSGTAAANFLPAVVEADSDLVPLVVLTADRPPLLRGIGANQTIDQIELYGKKVRWFCDVGLAEAAVDGNTYWRTTIAQAVARSRGHGGAPGPVHLNVGFREPTVPATDDGRVLSASYSYSIEGLPDARPWQRSLIASPGGAEVAGLEVARGLIVAGHGIEDPHGVAVQAARLGWPVLATSLSGMRGHRVVSSYHHLLVGGVPRGLIPDVVVSVGRVGPSDRLESITGLAVPQVQIDRWGRWLDPRRHSDFLVQADPVATLAHIEGRPENGWEEQWLALDDIVRGALDDRIADVTEPTGPLIARSLSSVEWGALVAGGSLPVRDVDAHTIRDGRVFANRGASGIDGFASTAIGVAAALPRTVAFGGDLTFLHDVSALSGGGNRSLVIVVADNNGGGLFDLLPHRSYAPAFERLFVAPHDQDLVGLSVAFGVTAARIDRPAELAADLETRLSSGGTHVVVVPIDREIDLALRRGMDEAAEAAIRSLE